MTLRTGLGKNPKYSKIILDKKNGLINNKVRKKLQNLRSII
jgi:hypothetical protein